MKMPTLFVVLVLSLSGAAYGADSVDQAVASLNARVKTPDDQKAVLTAISQQTQVPNKKLESDMKASHLGYGELLAAESLAMANGKSVSAVVALKTKGKGWGDVSKELKIDPSSIVTRLRDTEKSLQGGAKNARTARKGDSGKPDAPAPASSGY